MRLVDADALSEKLCETTIFIKDGEVFQRMIHDAPTVSAEPKTGKWVLDPDGMDWNIPAWRCSECGFVATHIGVGSNPMHWAGSKFCANCGARMRGEEG